MENSNKPNLEKIIIHCIGDVTLDHHIVYKNDIHVSSRFSPKESVKVYDQIGGAGFTSRLLERIGTKWGKYKVVPNKIPINYKIPSTFAIVKQIASKWRIAKFIGIEKRSTTSFTYPDKKAAGVIIHDFLAYTGEELGPIQKYLDNHKDLRVILLRMANFNKGSIFKEVFLQEKYKNITKKLITFISVDEIRSNSIQISQGLSWEKTFSDLYNAFQPTPVKSSQSPHKDISELLNSGYVVVLIDRFGFLLIDNYKKDKPIFRAIFYPKEIEVDNMIDKQGEIFGLTTCATLHVLKAIIEKDFEISNSIICKGLKNGLHSMSRIYENGFDIDLFSNKKVEMIFPFQKWQDTAEQEKVIEIEINNSIRKTKDWSILGSIYSNRKEFHELIFNVVKKGWENDSATKIPFVNFGKFVTADREEIEQYRAVRMMMEEHFKKPISTRPLSVVVLGQPGSGKSFGIKEVANSLENINSEKIKVLEFNIAQFTTIDDLYDSFTLIRDSYLSGNHVIGIWDEFDANFGGDEFGWIKYFLSPMQGGKYYNGPNEHLLGSPIFIFACSKFSTWDRLNKFEPEIEQQNKKKNPIIRPAKFDDFISRIHGHLEVKGINPQNREDFERNKPIYLRRAILLHSILEKHCSSIFYYEKNHISKDSPFLVADIDDDLVLNFVFEIEEYKHGLRSLEAIIQMSQLTGKKSFTPSCLPSLDQMRPHIGKNDCKIFSKYAST